MSVLELKGELHDMLARVTVLALFDTRQDPKKRPY